MQDQKLTTIPLASGIVKELQPETNVNYWVDADKVRFRFNKPELMGGWENVTTQQNTSVLQGHPRLLETVRTLTGERAAVVATHMGVFSSNLDTFNNITPIVTVRSAAIFSTSIGSSNVLVSMSAHGLTDETLWGVVSVSTTIGGNIFLNSAVATRTDYPVSVIDANSFGIDVGVAAAATSVAVTLSATYTHYYPAGLASNIISGGFGGGAYSGNFGWSDPTGNALILPLRQWSMDAWGTELMAVPDGGPLFLYSPQNGIASNLVVVTAAPSINSIVRVATEARHVVLYGTHDSGGDYDPLLIRWCSSEDYDDWTASIGNTAGDFRLNSRGSEIVGVVKMRDQTLIFTNSELFIQTYIGSNDVFGFVRAAENCGLIARNAAIEYGGAVYWVGANGQFYKYDGRVQPLQSTVLRYVFDNINALQKDKIYAGTNSQFDEVIFFYPTLDSPDFENDRYTIHNVVENHWNVGSMRRTTWRDRSTYEQILATGPRVSVSHTDGGLFYQETGYAADTSALVAFVESEYFDMDSGDTIMFANKLVPEFIQHDGEPLVEPVNITMFARKYPNDTPISKGPYEITADTRFISTRLRGREMALRIESSTSAAAAAWRLSDFRMGLQGDGKR